MFPGSNSPYDNLSANSSRALHVDLVSLCFDALLAAAEDLASQISSSLVGGGTLGSTAMCFNKQDEKCCAAL